MAKRFDICDRFWMLGGAGFPFPVDTNTYWWDITSARNTVDTTGSPSISKLAELVRGESSFSQPVKSLQPLTTANGAAYTTTPGTGSNADVVIPANGADGAYWAANIKTDLLSPGSQTLFTIRNDADSTNTVIALLDADRLRLSSNEDNIGGATIAARASTVVAKNTWTTVEVMLKLGVAVGVWYNGVAQTLNATNTLTTATFLTPSVSKVILNDAFFGEMKDAVYYNGAIPAANRTSISDYLNAQRPI